MSISSKGRRKIIVGDKLYLWYVALDDDSPFYILNIVSDDKYLILSCPLRTRVGYVISKGRRFRAKAAPRGWSRYLLPFDVPEIITPKFVERMITWAERNTDDTEAVPINGGEVPV